uniref:Uncharacterized protein n=1 Tax=Rhizophora mucronata TaxID=61149 RepID=A0A2P2NJ10_RHIMU
MLISFGWLVRLGTVFWIMHVIQIDIVCSMPYSGVSSSL